MALRLLALLLVALAGCTHTEAVNAPVPSRGKPTAPVAVSAKLGPRSAHLVVTFEGDAERASVAVSGVDGLVVEGPAVLLTEATVAKGEQRAFDVKFAPGAGRSQLAVTVEGRFGGAHRARVVAFSVGEGPPPEEPGVVTTTDDGQRVRVLPATP